MTKTRRPESVNEPGLPPMGACQSMAIFGSASVAMILETRILIPAASAASGREPVLFWFIIGGLGVFLPLLMTAALILRKEGVPLRMGPLKERLRLRPMSGKDWIWSLGTIIAAGVLMLAIKHGIEAATGGVALQPSFMAFEPLAAGRYWLLAVWAPYWVLNIMGEEVLWRGTMLPRQELVFGRRTWLIHGIGWGIFHLAFGWKLLVTLLPVLFALSYVVQCRKNTWIGVVIHGLVNGPCFLAIAFGLV